MFTDAEAVEADASIWRVPIDYDLILTPYVGNYSADTYSGVLAFGTPELWFAFLSNGLFVLRRKVDSHDSTRANEKCRQRAVVRSRPGLNGLPKQSAIVAN